MAEHPTYDFERAEKIKKVIASITSRGGEEDPWTGIDDMINLDRKTQLASSGRYDATRGIPAQGGGRMVAEQTINPGNAAIRQPCNGILERTAFSSPGVKKMRIPDLSPEPTVNKGFQMTGIAKRNSSQTMDYTTKTAADNVENQNFTAGRNYGLYRPTTRYGGRPTFDSNTQSPTVPFLSNVKITSTSNQSPRSLGFDRTGFPEMTPPAIGTKTNTCTDANDSSPGPSDQSDSEYDYRETPTFDEDVDDPRSSSFTLSIPEPNSADRRWDESNWGYESIRDTRHDLRSGDGESNKGKHVNPGSWLDRVPGEDSIDTTARSRKVYTPRYIEQRAQRMAAVRQQMVDRRNGATHQAAGTQARIQTGPSRQLDTRKRGGYCLNHEERRQIEVHSQNIAEDCQSRWSRNDSHSYVSASESRLTSYDYSQPRTITSETVTREDRARILRASNDRRAQARAAATELPSETTWCVGYDLPASPDRPSSPAFMPGRYMPENLPQQEEKRGRFRHWKKRSVTVIRVAPRDSRNPDVITDNSTNVGPFRRGMRALRHGLRRAGQSLHKLATSCACNREDYDM